MEDEVEGMGPLALIKLKEAGERLTRFEGDDGKGRVAGEREVEGGVGTAMPVAILLPQRGVSLVVVAVLDAPVSADGLRGARFVLGIEAREEKAGVGRQSWAEWATLTSSAALL